MPATPPSPEVVQNPVFDVAKLRELTKNWTEIVRYPLDPMVAIRVSENVDDVDESTLYLTNSVEIAPNAINNPFPITVTFYTSSAGGSIIQYFVIESGDSSSTGSAKFLANSIDNIFVGLKGEPTRTELK